MTALELCKAWAIANAQRSRWITVFRHLEQFSEGANILDFTEDRLGSTK
jgi:hypothetical protein